MRTEITAERPLVAFARRSREHASLGEFDALYQDQYPAVLRHLAYLTGDRLLAEDIAQETFGRLLAQCTAASDLQNPRAWLLTVASNIAYNHFRTEQRRTDRESRVAPDEGVEVTTDAAIDVRDALDRLDPRDRTMLLLRYAGFSYAEVAEAVGIQPSSVGTTLARAQRRFKEVYEPSTSTSSEE